MLAILIACLSIFLFGGMLLALVLGALRIESEREEERAAAARETHRQAAAVPRFFFVAPPTQPRPILQPDDALLLRLQRYLEAEQMLANEFVLQPSIERLYRESDHRLRGH